MECIRWKVLRELRPRLRPQDAGEGRGGAIPVVFSPLP